MSRKIKVVCTKPKDVSTTSLETARDMLIQMSINGGSATVESGWLMRLISEVLRRRAEDAELFHEAGEAYRREAGLEAR